MSSHTSKIIIGVSGLFVLFLVVVSVVSIYREGALFIPGLAPTPYKKGAPITLDVNKVTSIHGAIPYSYHSLPVCKPDKLVQESENLGAVITGNRLEESKIKLAFLIKKECEVLCGVDYTEARKKQMQELLQQEYQVQWQLDGLPAAVKVKGKDAWKTGFPLGTKENMLNNHIVISVHYNKHRAPSSEKKSDDEYNVVLFGIEPHSVKYTDVTHAQAECAAAETRDGLSVNKLKTNETVVFTYSVDWVEDFRTEWTNRWHNYRSSGDSQIHWFAIVNSLMVIFVLTGMIAVILAKTLRNDFLKIADDDEQLTNETGWKTLSTNVFRAPRLPILLSVLVGSGFQVLLMAVVTLIFSVLGFLSPANQGSLMTAVLVLYVWMGMAAGYASARLYQAFGGENTTKNTLMTALLFPGTIFAIASILNIPLAVRGSSGAFPFTTSLAIFALWVCISVPLCYLGSRFARSQDPMHFPGTVQLIPRDIPEQPWYLNPVLCVLMAGLLPFGAVFIELFFILTSIWMNQFYFLFGFLFLVFLIMIVTCAEISVVICYFQLSNMDYQWWWRAYLSSGSSAFYMYLYGIHYYFTALSITDGVAKLLYFGYMLILCLGFFVMTGTIGFLACLIFVRRIYKAIHQD